MDWKTNELKIPFNRKDYIIPVTIYKVKNKLEMNYANITPECDDLPVLDKVSQNSQNLSEDETLKKKCMSYEALKKKLFNTLRLNKEINKLCESLQENLENRQVI